MPHVRHFSSRSVFLSVALALLAGLSELQGQSTFTFRQSETYDQGGSTIRADNVGLNQGASGTYTPGQIASGQDLRAVFAFPLTGLSLGMTITSVQLTLTTNADASSQDGTFTLELYQLTSSFLESGGPGIRATAPMPGPPLVAIFRPPCSPAPRPTPRSAAP